MKKLIVFLLMSIFMFTQSIYAGSKIKIVTTLPFLKSIAREITKDKAEIYSIARGIEDPHHVEVKPSDMLKLNRADMLIEVGMDLDLWTQKLMTGARNPKIYYGAKGFVDASLGVEKLGVPTVRIDPSMGDIHIYGNPHYQPDPENGKVIAKNILDGLIRIDAENGDFYLKNYNNFIERLNNKIREWQDKIAPFKDTKIVVYHDQWVYFANRFNLDILDTIELKPGIPPTSKHLNQLINEMKFYKVKVIVMAGYLNRKEADYVASKTGAKVLILAHDVEAVKQANNYINMIDYNVSTLADALKK